MTHLKIALFALAFVAACSAADSPTNVAKHSPADHKLTRPTGSSTERRVPLSLTAYMSDTVEAHPPHKPRPKKPSKANQGS